MISHVQLKHIITGNVSLRLRLVLLAELERRLESVQVANEIYQDQVNELKSKLDGVSESVGSGKFLFTLFWNTHVVAVICI